MSDIIMAAILVSAAMSSLFWLCYITYRDCQEKSETWTRRTYRKEIEIYRGFMQNLDIPNDLVESDIQSIPNFRELKKRNKILKKVLKIDICLNQVQ